MTRKYVDGSAGDRGVPKDASDLWFWDDVLQDKPGPLDDVFTTESSKELDVLETSKSVFRLTYEEGQKDTTSIFDKIKMLPPKERAEVRKRARAMAEVLSAKDRLAVLLNLPEEEWDAAVAADELEEGQKGGPGSGHRGHGGRPGQRGGSSARSSGGFSSTTVDEAVTFVDRLVSRGGPIGDISISDDARAFLSQTVTKGSYKLYRGVGLVKGRISEDRMEAVRRLNPGDPAPDYLAKQFNPFASYTTKRTIAREFSEGKVSVIMQANVPSNDVVVVTRNLQKVMRDAGREDLFDTDRYDYFKDVAEVIVKEPISMTILSSKEQKETIE